MDRFRIGNVTIGGREPAFILGPCVIESEKFVRRMAQKIAKICDAENVSFIFKASYDKANRTSVKSFRGIDARAGCEILASIARELKIPVTTDVHSPSEATMAGQFIDLLQIPAFLCRQTDLLKATAETGRTVNVKKGQFLAPWDVKNIAEKLEKFGAKQFLFTERGTTFGYNNLVADFRSLAWIREAGYRVMFDATHSVQRPGGAGESTSGDGQQSREHRGKRDKDQEAAAQASTPSPGAGAQVHLPIGHEAKGLVLPDIDENGRLRGRFVAGTARRVDQDHMQFRELNITTYTEDNQIDLQIAMADSVLDLNTHVLSSPQRTTIKRADFEIVAD